MDSGGLLFPQEAAECPCRRHSTFPRSAEHERHGTGGATAAAPPADLGRAVQPAPSPGRIPVDPPLSVQMHVHLHGG